MFPQVIAFNLKQISDTFLLSDLKKYTLIIDCEKIVSQVVPIENNDSGCWDDWGYLPDAADAIFGELG